MFATLERILRDADDRQDAREIGRRAGRTLAQKVRAGDAVVLGVNEETGKTVVAEKREEPTTQKDVYGRGDDLEQLSADQDRLWNAENARIDRAHRALRSQFACDEAPVTFGREAAGVSLAGANMADPPPTIREREREYSIGLDVTDGVVTATCVRLEADGSMTQVATAREDVNVQPCCGKYEDCEQACVPRGRWQATGNPDDRILPRADEIEAEPDRYLVGVDIATNDPSMMIYNATKGTIVKEPEPDEPPTIKQYRYDKISAQLVEVENEDYAAMAVPPQPEIDETLRKGMCDSIDLLGETVLYETDGRGGKAYHVPAIVTCVQKSHVDLPSWRAAEESGSFAGRMGVRGAVHRGAGTVTILDDGIHVDTNPLPIPLEGTVHLLVFTPGEAMTYRELSVPYDASGSTPRSWRHRTRQEHAF